MDSITYTREGHGYLASIRSCPGGPTCRVVRNAEGQWTAWYYGSTLRNQVDADGSRSCACPRVDVPGDYATRREAAEAGVSAWRDERRFVALAALCGMDTSRGGPYRLSHVPYLDTWTLGNDYDSATFRPRGGSLPGNCIPALAGVTDPAKAAQAILAHVDVP